MKSSCRELRARNERFVICILVLLNWGSDICIFCLFGWRKSGLDFECFWLIGNRVGIDVPKVEVRFEKLSIEGDAYVGSRALPTLLNSSLNMIEVFYIISIDGKVSLFISKFRMVNSRICKFL